MRGTWINHVVVCIFLALCARLVVLEAQKADLAKAVRTEAFARDSLAAVLDTTKKQMIAGQAYWTKQVVQTRLERDSVDKALQQVSRARASLAVQIAERNVSAEAPVTAENDVRTATFTHDSTPYHISAIVRLPPPPSTGTAQFNVKVDPLRIGVRVGCAVHFKTVRTAFVNIDVPSWADVAIETAKYERDVCNTPPPVIKKSSAVKAFLYGAATGVLVPQVLRTALGSR